MIPCTVHTWILRNSSQQHVLYKLKWSYNSTNTVRTHLTGPSVSLVSALVTGDVSSFVETNWEGEGDVIFIELFLRLIFCGDFLWPAESLVSVDRTEVVRLETLDEWSLSLLSLCSLGGSSTGSGGGLGASSLGALLWGDNVDQAGINKKEQAHVHIHKHEVYYNATYMYRIQYDSYMYV